MFGWVFLYIVNPSKGRFPEEMGVPHIHTPHSLGAWKQENIISSQKHGYVIPLIRGNVNCCVGRVLIAGDNLGFVDPLTA